MSKPHMLTNDVTIQMAKKAEEEHNKAEAAKEAAFKKEEAEKAEKARKLSQDKRDAEAKEISDRKASMEAKGAEEKKAEIEKTAQKQKRFKEKSKKNHPTKLRVKLPPIDSYEKELEYIPDVPGRVVVRLERLMGTDRVRITDTKYLKTLLNQLEAEEQVIWAKRAKQRKLAERNRFRQLAIEGHMEPGPDMQDLFQHPVFRVNRILNRLSKLDTRINHTPARKLPPITPSEPFEEYEKTGKLFDFHPDHYLKTHILYKKDSQHSRTSVKADTPEEEQQKADEFLKNLELAKKAAEDSAASIGGPAVPVGTDIRKADEWGGEDFDEEEEDEENIETPEPDEEDQDESEYDEKCAVEVLGRGSLTDAKFHYGIGAEVDLLAEWKPFRSELIDKVYDDEAEGGGADEMYEFAKAVLGTYKRENMKADNFVTKGLRNFK